MQGRSDILCSMSKLKEGMIMSNKTGRRLGARRDVDMTQGSIVRHIICFAFPLLLGNLFQQL